MPFGIQSICVPLNYFKNMDCDMTTENILTKAHLQKLQFAPMQKSQLVLNHHDEVLSVDKVLRLLPGKRVVFSGRWNNKPVIAKCFFDSGAAAHAKRDYDGFQNLAKAGVLIPRIYFYGTSGDKKIWLLIFQKIIGTHVEASMADEKALKKLTIEIATHHVLGVLQHDLHLNNFMIARKKVYTLDAGQMTFYLKPLAKKKSMHNLALFFSQLGIGQEKLTKKLYQVYTDARGWSNHQKDYPLILALIKKSSLHRLAKFKEKLSRSSSAFVRVRKGFQVSMANRSDYTTELQTLIAAPDAYMTREELSVLKSGRSTTVVKVQCGHQIYVIKRYNVNNFWHWLRRCFRTTRAEKNWRLGSTLHFMGVNTAKPIAFIEKNFFGFKGKSYLVLENIDGPHIGEFLEKANPLDLSFSDFAEKTVSLIENLADFQITHGDLKMTNILVNDAKQPVLIDLDGMRQFRIQARLKASLTLELSRFMQNWQDKPLLYALFDTALSKLKARAL
jgi:tRNA A-37 threonylcarbamoyl transferase component Bud32